MFFSGKIKHIEQFSRRDSFHEFEKFPYFDTHSIHLTLLSSIFPLLFSKIETENVICQSTKFFGKKWWLDFLAQWILNLCLFARDVKGDLRTAMARAGGPRLNQVEKVEAYLSVQTTWNTGGTQLQASSFFAVPHRWNALWAFSCFDVQHSRMHSLPRSSRDNLFEFNCSAYWDLLSSNTGAQS